MSIKTAIILSGCGVYDGSEIHEATLSMLSVMKNGGSYQIFAPNTSQHHVVNHITGEEMDESRNVLVESARIARGNVLDLREYDPVNFDVLLIPGGFGAAKNLCDYAIQGTEMEVHKSVSKAILETHAQGKPIGALCIAPVLLAKLLPNAELTIGEDATTALDIETMGGKHTIKGHGEIVIDEKNKLVTTPCYMLDATIVQIAEGAENVVKALFAMVS